MRVIIECKQVLLANVIILVLLSTSFVVSPVGGFSGDIELIGGPLEIYTNRLVGSVPVRALINEAISDLQVNAVFMNSTSWLEQSVDSHPFRHGSLSEYLYSAPSKLMTRIPAGIPKVEWSMYHYNGAYDVDMGNFYDSDCDGIYALDDEIDTGHFGATHSNPEVFSTESPSPGCYWIHVAGVDSDAGALFDLTLEKMEVGTDWLSVSNVPKGRIPARRTATFDLLWNLSAHPVDGWRESNILLGSGSDPYLSSYSVRLKLDRSAPASEDAGPSGTIETRRPFMWATFTDEDGELSRDSVRFELDGVNMTFYCDIHLPFTSDQLGSYGYYEAAIRFQPLFDLAFGAHSVNVSIQDFAGNPSYVSWTFTIGDMTPPIIDHTPEVMLSSGYKVPITAKIMDNFTVGTFDLYFKTSASPTFEKVPMRSEGFGNQYWGVVPSQRYPGDIYYFLQATDTEGNSATLPRVDPMSNPYHITINPFGYPRITHRPMETHDGTSFTISATISDNGSAVSATLYFKGASSPSYTPKPMTWIGGHSFSATIPASALSEEDVLYYIEAFDGVDTVAHPPNVGNPHMVSYAGASPNQTLRIGMIDDITTVNPIAYGGFWRQWFSDYSTSLVLEPTYDSVGKWDPSIEEPAPYILKGIDADDNGVFDLDEYGAYAKESNPREVTAYYDLNGVYFHDGVQVEMDDLLFSHHLAALDPTTIFLDMLKDNNGLPGSNFSSTHWLNVWPAEDTWDPSIPVGPDASLTFALHFSQQADDRDFVSEVVNGMTLLPRYVWEVWGRVCLYAVSGVCINWDDYIHNDFGYAYDPVIHNGVPPSDPFAFDFFEAREWVVPDDYVVGSGPFEFGRWNPGTSVELERFDDYYVDAKRCKRVGSPPVCQGDFYSYLHSPYVSRMNFTVYESIQPATFALQEGEVDIVPWPMPSDKALEFLTEPEVGIVTTVERGFAYLGYNMRDEPFGYPGNDPANGDTGYHLRKAIAHLAEKDRILSTLLQNFGVWGTQPVSPSLMRWYNASVTAYDLNLTKAKMILDDHYTIGGYALGYGPSGYRNLPAIGDSQIEILTPQMDYDPVRAMAGTLIAHNMRAVGLNAIAKPLPFLELCQRLDNKDMQMWILSWRIGSEPPDYYYAFFHSSNAATGQNYVGYQNARFDTLITNALSTADAKEARVLLRECSGILADELPYDVLYFRASVEGYRSDRFTNWTVGPTGSILHESFWSWIGVRQRSTEREGVAEVEEGGTLRVGVKGIVDLNPKSPNEASSSVIDLLYDALGRLDPNTLEMTPWLAQSWTVDEANQTVDLSLKSNLTWHDGSPVTANDVEYTFETFYGGYNVSVLSAEHARFNFPGGGGGRFMTGDLALPLIKAGEANPVEGCGPFELIAFETGKYALIRSNPSYFAGRPRIDFINFTSYATTAEVINTFINGSLDLIDFSLTIDELLGRWYWDRTLLSWGVNAGIPISPGLSYLYVGFNTSSGMPLSEPGLRVALAKLLNKELFNLISPLGEITDSVMSNKNIPWYNASIPRYNTGYTLIQGRPATNYSEGARKLDEEGYLDLDADGWREKPDGSPLALSLLGHGLDEDLKKAGIAKGYTDLLRQVGLNVTLELSSSADPRDFDIYLGLGHLSLDPSGMGDMPEVSRFADANLSSLLQQLNDSLNENGRRSTVKDILGLLSQDVPFAPVLRYKAIEVFDSSRFSGWVQMPGGVNNFWSYLQLHALFDTGIDAPRGLHAFYDITPTVTLTWGANEETDLQRYSVFRASVSGGPYSLLDHLAPRTAFVDFNVSMSEQYCYVVVAGDSPLSNEVCIVLSPIIRPPSGPHAHLSVYPHANVILNWTLSPDDGAGINDVVRYDIYRGIAYDPAGSSYVLHDTVPNGTAGYADVGVGEGYPLDYFYLVCAVGSTNSSSCSPAQAAKFTRSLNKGPNLVSIPLIQSDESIARVLQTVEYDKAWFYDSSSQEWIWHMTFKAYRRGLWTVNHTMGLWVNVTSDCNLTVAGVVPAQTMIYLHKGWNLVGFPSFNATYTVSDLKTEVGATSVEGYDSLSPYYLRILGDLEVLQAGYGYWVMVEADTVWTIEVS